MATVGWPNPLKLLGDLIFGWQPDEIELGITPRREYLKGHRQVKIQPLNFDDGEIHVPAKDIRWFIGNVNLTTALNGMGVTADYMRKHGMDKMSNEELEYIFNSWIADYERKYKEKHPFIPFEYQKYAYGAFAGVIGLGVFMIYRTFGAMRAMVPGQMKNIDWRTAKIYKGGFDRDMTKKEAALILGCAPSSSRALINTRYKALMKTNHPDVGGSSYLSHKINQAKSIILKAEEKPNNL